jgi:hypothetical protein
MSMENGDKAIGKAGNQLQATLNPYDETPRYAFVLVAMKIGEPERPTLVSNITDSEMMVDLLEMAIEGSEEYIEVLLNHPTSSS